MSNTVIYLQQIHRSPLGGVLPNYTWPWCLSNGRPAGAALLRVGTGTVRPEPVHAGAGASFPLALVSALALWAGPLPCCCTGPAHQDVGGDDLGDPGHCLRLDGRTGLETEGAAADRRPSP